MPFCESEGPVRKPLPKILSWLTAVSVLPFLAGCIAHAPGSGGQQQILVGVASTPPSPASVSVSTPSTPSTVQYTATVQGTSNTAVTWSLSDFSGATTVCTASGNGLGTIATTGNNTMTYTAPQTVPVSPCGIVVTATSNQDNVTTGQALVNVNVPQISLAVSSSPASPASVPVSSTTTPSTVLYTANVTPAGTAVTWSLAADPNATTVCTASGSGLGTIVSTGTDTATYTAPPTLPMSPCGVTVTATAGASENMTTAQALVNVHVLVTVSPIADTIGQEANRQYTATVSGATNQSVNWSESCPACPLSQTGGKFDVNNLGLYYAPQLNPGTTQLTDTVTATSAFDPQQSATATMTVVLIDPLGTVTPSTAAAAIIPCPTFSDGLTGATCYQVSVSCDAIADYPAYLKVNTPTGTPLGTVIFGTENGGTTLYDNDPLFIAGAVNGGENVVQDVLNSGYTTVQVSFGGPFSSSASTNGWLQGPGGVRRLACRYATTADWVYKNIHNSNTSAPMCATGHREGSGALGYAVSEYGLASELSLVEHTSGPAMTRLAWGCNVCGGQYLGSDPCTQTSGVNMCYAGTNNSLDITAATIDAAYQVQGQTTPTLCTDGLNGTITTNFSRFQSDSIEDDPGVTPAFPIPNPPTNVKVLLGMLDTGTAALPQGYEWWGGVGPQPPAVTPCPADWPQAIPSVADGAAQIVSDIKNMCTVH
jgi:hypothetical protein